VTNAAILVLAGTETHADLGRITNALQAAKEFDDAGDDVEILFDGAGTQWVAELTDDDHDLNPLYESLEDHVSVCEYCSGAFGVEGSVEASDATSVGEFEGHPSVRDLVTDGYEVVTY
jgi:hypothetical protein